MITPDGSNFCLVLDLEATDLDERSPTASLLEIGAILTRDDEDLTVVGRASLLVRPPGQRIDLDRIWAAMHQAARDMHTASGLWNEATTSDSAWSTWEADAGLCDWLDSLGATPGHQVALAGSGVSHYDSRWLREHLPKVHSRVTYWSLDAGVLRRFLDYARRPDLVDLVGDVEAKPHRALADADLHLAEIRRYLDLLRSIPALQDAGVPADTGA